VFYIDGEIVYIGSTANLQQRMRTPWGKGRLTLKYAISKRYGDWLMREARLIGRLRPPHNVVGNPLAQRNQTGGITVLCRVTGQTMQPIVFEGAGGLRHDARQMNAAGCLHCSGGRHSVLGESGGGTGHA
jgi:hypothetical protein